MPPGLFFPLLSQPLPTTQRIFPLLSRPLLASRYTPSPLPLLFLPASTLSPLAYPSLFLPASTLSPLAYPSLFLLASTPPLPSRPLFFSTSQYTTLALDTPTNASYSLVYSILAIVSIGVGTIQASYIPNECDNLVDAFNDNNSDVEFLIINISLSIARLNLYYNYYYNIVVQYLQNYQSLFQVFSRLYYIGQPYIVRQYIVIYSGIYLIVLEDKIYRKIVPKILFTGYIPEQIKGTTLYLIVTYKILYIKFAYLFNHFIQVINPPKDVSKYTSLYIEYISKLYSTFVLYLLLLSLEDPATTLIVQLAKQTVVYILYFYTTKGYKRYRTNFENFEQIVKRIGVYTVKCKSTPFQYSKTYRIDVYTYFNITPKDYKQEEVDLECNAEGISQSSTSLACYKPYTYTVDLASYLHYSAEVGEDKGVDLEYTSGIEDPANVQELEIAISDFLAKNNIANPPPPSSIPYIDEDSSNVDLDLEEAGSGEDYDNTKGKQLEGGNSNGEGNSKAKGKYKQPVYKQLGLVAKRQCKQARVEVLDLQDSQRIQTCVILIYSSIIQLILAKAEGSSPRASTRYQDLSLLSFQYVTYKQQI